VKTVSIARAAAAPVDDAELVVQALDGDESDLVFRTTVGGDTEVVPVF